MQMLKAFVIVVTEDEKQNVTVFRMCQNEALRAVHIFQMTPTQIVWNGVV